MPAIHDMVRPAPASRRAAFALPAPAQPARSGTGGRAAHMGGVAAYTAANGDRATRIQLLADVNRSAGNRAAANLVASARRPVQRDDDEDNPYADTDADTSYTLANARFTGSKRLQEIAGGGAALAKKDPAAAVKPVQTALLDLGYSLLRYKDDGSFGDETAQAIAQFRTDRGVAAGDGMDAAAIRRLDQLAPAPGKKEEHYLDYSRLFEDGKLDVTLAIGYDEGQSHFDDLNAARAWMDRMKLVKASSAAPPPPAPVPGAPDVITGASPVVDPNADTKKGISTPEVYTGKRSVTYPDKTGARVTKEIVISITLVPPGTGGKAAFAKGLNDSEITLYSGHARRGIGPDFDADKSPYENFVIGVGSALHKAGRVQAAGAVAESHYVIDKKNDLEAMKAAGTWNEERYRVWFFNACSSIAYMDELRGGLLPEKMDRHNLDLFGTTQSVPIAAGLSPVLANLEGVMAGETMEQIVVRMRTSMLEAFRKELAKDGRSEAEIDTSAKGYGDDVFIREGAGDNQVAAAP
jgi:peptidoglycan hydrolase-like protein with peptidoglycan-binding domain